MDKQNDTEIAHQLGSISARLDTISEDLRDIRDKVRRLELSEAKHATRLTILTSTLSAILALLGSYFLGAVGS